MKFLYLYIIQTMRTSHFHITDSLITSHHYFQIECMISCFHTWNFVIFQITNSNTLCQYKQQTDLISIVDQPIIKSSKGVQQTSCLNRKEYLHYLTNSDFPLANLNVLLLKFAFTDLLSCLNTHFEITELL